MSMSILVLMFAGGVVGFLAGVTFQVWREWLQTKRVWRP